MGQPNQLTIQLRLEGTNQVVSAVQQVQSQFTSFQQTLQAGFNLNLGAKLAETILRSVGAFRQAMQEGLQYAASLKDMSLQSGLTAAAVQVLGHAASQSGGGIENVRSALGNLRQASVAAQTGNEELAAAFAQLGIDARTITDLPLEAQLEAVARGFAATGGTGQAYVALVRILGERDVPRLQGVLQQLAQQGLPGMAKSMQRNGALLSDDLVEAADRIDDRWGDLKVKMKATFAEWATALEPLWNLLSGISEVALMLMKAFRGIGAAIGAVGAVLSGTNWKDALEAWANIVGGEIGKLYGTPQSSSGSGGPPSPLPPKADTTKATGPSIAEMAADQRRIGLSMQPLWVQQKAAQDEVAEREKELQRLMDEGNAKGLHDTRKLSEASLAVTKAKYEAWKIDQQVSAELGRQQGQIAANADLEASMKPLLDQRAHAQANLTAAEEEVARLYAAELIDATALNAAVGEQLRAKQALKALDEQIARERAEKDNQAALDAADATARRLAADRAKLEADFTRTAAEKWPERKRILGEEIANQQTLLAVLLAKRDAARASGDRVSEGVFDQSARSVSTGLDSLRNQQNGLGPNPLSFGQQISAAITAAQTSIGTFAEQVRGAFTSVGDSIRTSLGSAFATAVLEGGTFAQRAAGFASAVGTAFVNAGAQMVADWIYSHTIMAGVRAAFNALGITKKAATTATETGIHAAGETAKTAATIAGEATRSGVIAGAAAANTGVVTAEAGTIAGATGIAGVFRSIMELGPIAGPAVFAASIAGMIALVNSIANGFATGGLVTGPGGPTDDRVLARLSNGEFVATAAAVDRFGPAFFHSLNQGSLDLAALPSSAVGQIPMGVDAVAAHPRTNQGSSAGSPQGLLDRESGDGGSSNIRIFVHVDEAIGRAWLERGEGKRVLYRHIMRDRHELGLPT